jgi:hypothetical protein
MTLALAATIHAAVADAPAPAAPALAPPPPTPALDHLPADADAVILVRLGPLMASEVWRTLAAADVHLFDPLRAVVPTALDFQTLVTDIAYALRLEADPAAAALHVGAVIHTSRDVEAEGFPVVAVPGAAATVYQFDETHLLGLPRPRVVMVGPGAWMFRPSGEAPPLSPAPLRVRGEVTFAARMTPALRARFADALDASRRALAAPGADSADFMAFALRHNLARIAQATTSLTGRLDLSQPQAALVIEFHMDAPDAMATLAAALEALAEPAEIALPRIVGGNLLAGQPAQPLFTVRADGAVVTLTMTREAVLRAARRVADAAHAAARAEANLAAGLANLAAVGQSVRAYVAARGTHPQTWGDLVSAGLVPDPTVLSNPRAAVARPGGDYALVPLTARAARRDPAQTILAYEVWPSDAEPADVCVLMADGHAQPLPRDVFHTLLKQTLESLGR